MTEKLKAKKKYIEETSEERLAFTNVTNLEVPISQSSPHKPWSVRHKKEEESESFGWLLALPESGITEKEINFLLTTMLNKNRYFFKKK